MPLAARTSKPRVAEKDRERQLKQLRAEKPSAVLAEAQLQLARDYGFDSWRKLKRHVEEQERSVTASEAASAPPLTRDQVVKGFLKLVGTGQIDEVRRILAAAPQMVNVVGPHPFWGGRPQPLHVAIETKRRDMFDLLLDAGADVNGTNGEYDHWSPLMLASDQDREDMRDELLRRGARVGLMEALMLADDERVEELLRPGASALPAYAPNGGSVLEFRADDVGHRSPAGAGRCNGREGPLGIDADRIDEPAGAARAAPRAALDCPGRARCSRRIRAAGRSPDLGRDDRAGSRRRQV